MLFLVCLLAVQLGLLYLATRCQPIDALLHILSSPIWLLALSPYIYIFIAGSPPLVFLLYLLQSPLSRSVYLCF